MLLSICQFSISSLFLLPLWSGKPLCSSFYPHGVIILSFGTSWAFWSLLYFQDWSAIMSICQFSFYLLFSSTLAWQASVIFILYHLVHLPWFRDLDDHLLVFLVHFFALFSFSLRFMHTSNTSHYYSECFTYFERFCTFVMRCRLLHIILVN